MEPAVEIASSGTDAQPATDQARMYAFIAALERRWGRLDSQHLVLLDRGLPPMLVNDLCPFNAVDLTRRLDARRAKPYDTDTIGVLRVAIDVLQGHLPSYGRKALVDATSPAVRKQLLVLYKWWRFAPHLNETQGILALLAPVHVLAHEPHALANLQPLAGSYRSDPAVTGVGFESAMNLFFVAAEKFFEVRQ